MEEYDAIIIGGGHNGLILGNYLVRTGLNTLILERRPEVGGGLTTEEITIPGFSHNLHSYFHDTVNIMPAFADLELESFNARYVRPPVQAGLALQDGQAVTIHSDINDTCGSIGRISKHDAIAYREITENYGEFMEAVIIPALYSAPQPPSAQVAILETSPEGLDFLRMGRLSPEEVLDEYFENDNIKALLLHQLPIPRGILHDYHGLGNVIPLVISQVEHSQICIGGSHVLAHALWRAFFSGGGKALGLKHVTKIVIEGGEARGVEVSGGERFRATKLVASAIDLRQTFLEMIGEEHLESNFLNKIRNFKLDEFSIFSVHLALREPPLYRCARFNPAIDRAFKVDIGLETPSDYRLLWSEIRRGRLPDRPGLFCSVPTLFDPLQAPKGMHTAFLWQPVPYALEDGGPEKWDEIKDEYMAFCLDRWRQVAPNLTEDNILMKKALSPLDIERKIYNMKRGGVFMGRMVLGQIEHFRPLPDISQYRTPIGNLYLCGACCHPGGGIIGAAGMIAAEVIAEDFGLRKWWQS